MRTPLIVVLLLTLVLSLPLPVAHRVQAQDPNAGLNNAIPECTLAQTNEVRELVLSSGIFDDMLSASDQLVSATIEERYAIIADTDAHQQRWWTEIVPGLPVCAFAQRVIATVGRYIDEFMLSTTYLQIGLALQNTGSTSSANRYLAMADAHLDTSIQLNVELSLLTPVLFDTGEVPSTLPTGAIQPTETEGD